MLPGSAVHAGGYYHGHGYHGHGYHGYGGHYYHHGDGDDLLIAAGIIGGVILLGSLLTRPRYYARPAYYRPALTDVPTCYQDEVWRRLPDGRIQTGIRTRCY